MIRVALEAIITITVLLIARAIISSILRSFSNPAVFNTRPQNQASGGYKPADHAPVNGTLHRDPVCGTFVPETTPFRRDQAGSTYYYCSKSCRESHSLVSHT
jgi:YHS domain-containing protein